MNLLLAALQAVEEDNDTFTIDGGRVVLVLAIVALIVVIFYFWPGRRG
jgi:hypothetical protein